MKVIFLMVAGAFGIEVLFTYSPLAAFMAILLYLGYALNDSFG